MPGRLAVSQVHDFQDALPGGRGLWSDSSEEMERHVRTTLSRFGDRVDYLIADMRDPRLAPASADLIMCVHATHSLGATELTPFYRGSTAASPQRCDPAAR